MALPASSPAHDSAPGRVFVVIAQRSRDLAERWAIGLVLVGAAATLLVQGFEFPNYNNIVHVGIVLDYAHSAEGPHDAFHQTLTHYTSVLWPLLSLVATERNIAALFFAVYALNRIALAIFLYLIARELLPTCRRSVLAMAISIVVLLWWAAWGLSPLGGNDIFVRSLSQTQLTVTALAACLWLMLRRRWLAVAVCLGAAFNINAFMAMWGGVIALTVYAWVHRAAPPRSILRHATVLGATAAVLALPTLIWIGWTMQAGLPAAPFDYRAYIGEFYPRHNLLDGNWSGVLVAAMVAAITWTYVRDNRLFASARTKQIIGASFAAVCGILLIGMTMPYLVNSRLLYCLFPLRMDSYLIVPLLAVLVAVALARAYGAADEGAFWSEALIVVSVAAGNVPLALLASIRHKRGARVVAIGLLLLAAILVAAAGGVPIYYRPSPGKAAVLAICQAVAAAIAVRAGRLPAADLLRAAGLIAPEVLPDPLAPWARWIIVGVYAGAGVSLTDYARPWRDAPDAWLHSTNGRSLRPVRTWAAPVILVAALAAGVARVWTAGSLNYLSPEVRTNVAAQLWLRQHSKPDELVLAVNVDGFSTLSRRPVWVDSQMGSAVMWAPGYYPTWHSRMAEVGRLHRIRDAVDYARANHIPYIVMPRGFGTTANVDAEDAAEGADMDGGELLYTNHNYMILASGEPHA